MRSISINLSYRITLELLIQDGQIIPVNVGDHDAVYCCVYRHIEMKK